MYPVKEITIPKQLLELFCYPSVSPDTGKTILSSTSPITFSSFFITDNHNGDLEEYNLKKAWLELKKNKQVINCLAGEFFIGYG